MQKKVLLGDVTVGSATLVNLRLMRCTSAYLSQYSYPELNDPHSRLGLNITYKKDSGSDPAQGLTSFVLGGWCVGTVLDSAASRSMQGPMVRVAPQSMAMNVNVNIEWWSANDLHRHYSDKSWDIEKLPDLCCACPRCARAPMRARRWTRSARAGRLRQISWGRSTSVSRAARSKTPHQALR